MKNNCKIVQDLLPLYHDNVCSADSKEMVENHLSECETCRKLLAKMEDDTCVNTLQNECQDVIAHHNKEIKRKSALISTCAAGVFMIPILVCLIVNLATGHTLDWFFIVLTALMTTASVTVVPFVMGEKKFLWTMACFTISVLLLLLCCCLYSGGTWFFIAAVSVLLGLSVLFLPVILRQLPLNEPYSRHAGLLSMAADTLLLYALILTVGFYAQPVHYWKNAFLITTIGAAFLWVLFLIIRYARGSALVKAGVCVIITGAFTAGVNDVIEWIIYGDYRAKLLGADFSMWTDSAVLDANLKLLILLIALLLGILLIAAGAVRKMSAGRKQNN